MADIIQINERPIITLPDEPQVSHWEIRDGERILATEVPTLMAGPAERLLHAITDICRRSARSVALIGLGTGMAHSIFAQTSILPTSFEILPESIQWCRETWAGARVWNIVLGDYKEVLPGNMFDSILYDVDAPPAFDILFGSLQRGGKLYLTTGVVPTMEKP